MTLDTTITIISAALLFVSGIVTFFENRGGWTLYWAEKRRERK